MRSPELFIQDMLKAIKKIERYRESIEDPEKLRGRILLLMQF